MILSAMDDYFIHQIVEPVRHIATSDRNFYDRHYFNVHACNSDFYLILGLGQYPNLGTQDAFLLLVEGGKQTALRSSRALGDRGDMSCGPIRIEVIEGLKTLRIKIAPNETGIEGELIFNARHAAVLEPRNVDRRFGRVVYDVLRYNQTAAYEGWLKLSGETYSSERDTLRGYRDRSWGIRPVGEPEPPGIRGAHHAAGSTGAAANFRWIHMPAQFEDSTVYIKIHEDNSGHRYAEGAHRVWHDGRPTENLGRPEAEFHYGADRRFVERARISCTQPGAAPLLIEVTELVQVFAEIGSGYGRGADADWTHGQYRGELVTDVVTYDLRRPNPKTFGGMDCLARMEINGDVGYGLFEYSVFGRFDRDGFSGPGYFNKLSDPSGK